MRLSLSKQKTLGIPLNVSLPHHASRITPHSIRFVRFGRGFAPLSCNSPTCLQAAKESLHFHSLFLRLFAFSWPPCSPSVCSVAFSKKSVSIRVHQWLESC